MNKSFLATVAVIAIMVGSIAYFITSPATSTHPPNSASKESIGNGPSNLTEAKKPAANVTAIIKPPVRSIDVKKPIANVTEPKIEPIIYVHVISASSGKGLSGMRAIVTPYNSTSDFISVSMRPVGNQPGVSGTFHKLCLPIGLPPRALLTPDTDVILANGTKVIYPKCPIITYTTNSTGWATVYRFVSAKYYSVGILYGFRSSISETIQVHENQTIYYLTMKVPVSEPTPAGGLSHGEPLLSKGFLSVEKLLDFTEMADSFYQYHFTMRNGSSANFTLTFMPNKECLEEACQKSDFPLRMDSLLKVANMITLDPTCMCLVYSVDGSNIRRLLAVVEYYPQSKKINLSMTVAPNPSYLGRDDRVNITVTLTAKNNASYGVYFVRPGGMVKSAVGRELTGVYRGYIVTISTFPVQIGNPYVAQQKVSKYLGNSTWFRLNYNGTLDADSDSGSRQIGWWQIGGDQLVFILSNTSFRGRIIGNASLPAGSSIVLDDGSKWSVRQGD